MRRTSIFRVAGLALAMALFQPLPGAAAPVSGASSAGRLDRAFGQGGFRVIARNTYSVNDVRQSANGGIIVAVDFAGAGNAIGGFAIERLTAGGAVDTSFGSAGAAVAQFSDGFNAATCTATQSDGKIVAVGFARGLPSGPDTIAVARFMPNGVLDPSFGSGGRVVPNIAGSSASAAGVVFVLPSGQILVGGGATFAGGNSGVVIRLQPNGALDPAFGDGGVAVTGIPAGVNGLGIQKDAKIAVLEGTVATRLLPGGAIDPDHTRGAIVAETHNGTSLLTPDERIVAAEGLPDGGSRNDIDARAFRLFPDGSLDTSFNSPLFDFIASDADTFDQSPHAVLQQADGKFVIGGVGQTPSGASEFGLARFSNAGAFDPAFGTSGISVSPLDGNDQLLALGLQSDGKILAAGLSFTAVGMIVARYSPR